MKLSEHVDALRHQIEAAFDKQFARLGIGAKKTIELEKLPAEQHAKRQRLEEMLTNHIGETGDYQPAREKLLDELTFTLFNRIAAIKVMESASLFPPIIIKQPEHGDRSFGHKAWLETHHEMRGEELEGIREYIKHAFNELGETLPLYKKDFPYALLPDAISLNEIIDAFNAIENDTQVEKDIWKSDDILGWLYESYNNAKKVAFKESKAKTEYDKVSLQSQVYTPRWVVQFLVDNSLGKLYLEMYPDSEIKDHYKIANPPEKQERNPKPLHEIKLIDPASGSGNFLLYAFDFFYALYLDQIENYGADYEEQDIPKWIIENNLHGIDLDDRAIQLAQLGLYIKARKKCRSTGNLQFNVVSSDFYLPDYQEIRPIFEEGSSLDHQQKQLIAEIWDDLQDAYKFGSLIRLDEKITAKLTALKKKNRGEQLSLFPDDELTPKPDPIQPDIFIEHDIREEQEFAATFFNNLKKAVEQYARTQSNTFLSSKTRDAITFLELLTTEYDVATANPPYTDSSDFGKELKAYIDKNYKKPYKFHTNLYATFIKRCYELLSDNGYFATIQPLTFMYIKTFEGVRQFILDKTHIDVFVELGLGGVFLTNYVAVYAASYILKKTDVHKKESLFINFQAYHGKLNKEDLFTKAFDNYINGIPDKHNYSIQQSKLKIIKSNPFIYWISDKFREKFANNTFKSAAKIVEGLTTADNNMFLRFWWEIDEKSLHKKWFPYSKGGEFNKYYGNMWTVINWEDDGSAIKAKKGSSVRNKEYYFKEGITFSSAGSKGASFRLLEKGAIFDSGSRSIFIENNEHVNYLLGVLNSKLVKYTIDCLNPTVNTTVGDIERIPFVIPPTTEVNKLVATSVQIKRRICDFSFVEPNFLISPVQFITSSSDIKARIKAFFNYENHLLTQVLINEAIINEKIFEIYELTPADKVMVLAKEGESIGGLPVCESARNAYCAEQDASKEFPLNNIQDFINALSIKEFTTEVRQKIEEEFPTLYQSNNNLEEFCIRHQINPINVWYWFKQSNVIPKQRMNDLALEFLADMIREILMEDEDGIVPLVSNAGEKVLLDRVEEKFQDKGFSSAQYSSFDSVLGKPLSEYLNKYFFAALSEHLNLFRHLPMTPFIWHFSSGPLQGFDCYIIIYKWSRDKLMRLKSVYIEHRERALINRQSDLSSNESAEAQNEKDLIFRQLKEIEAFKVKIDELLEEGYHPILDDGVGKNIAPLQKKKMIPYEVLNAGQLKKYLNADW